MRVLYVSDSLGAPIHPRGIFNFSVSLVEILKDAGASVDLLVEGSADYSLEGRFGGLAATAPDAVNSVRLAEIHRYFNFARFGFDWPYASRRYRALYAALRPLLWLWVGARDWLRGGGAVAVRNDLSQIDFVPPKGEHLKLFDGLVVRRGFYSSSMSRANRGLPAPVVDASGYDLAVIDTPHFVRFQGIEPQRILAVVHDLIPLRDPTMDANWRNLFMRKLEATLALGANLAFVSRHTQRGFHAAFPRHAAPREFVIPPAIRRKLMSEAKMAEAGAAAPMPAISAEAGSHWTRADDRTGKRKKTRQAGRRSGAPPDGFDPSLPYFVTATSDEARKNIAAVVRAFRAHLEGRANIVVLGDVRAERYDTGADSNVYFPGYVSEDRKIAFLRGARGVVFASLSEGFGIPIVEGAVMGAPVICSNIEVFREVAGADAFYFDPRDPLSLAAAVKEALADEAAARARAADLRRAVLARFAQDAVGETVRGALAEMGLPSRRAESGSRAPREADAQGAGARALPL